MRRVIRFGMMAALCVGTLMWAGAATAQPKRQRPHAAANDDPQAVIRATAEKLERQWQAGKPDMSPGSVGNKIGHGLEYLKEAKCEDASRWFERGVQDDAKDGLAHLLLGISYAGLNRAAEAQEHLKTAARLNPKLKGEADRWVARSTVMQRTAAEKQKAPAEANAAAPNAPPAAPATQPATRAVRAEDGLDDKARQEAMQAGPPPGNYTCHEASFEYVGGTAPWKMRFEYKGYFALQAGGVYRWLDNGPTGRYEYDPATGKLTFSSGYFANVDATGQFIPRDKVWQINIKIPAGPDKFNEWQAAMNR
ncbi:MAG TPA: hypothetical protein VHP11_04130 [Tepidisphaeraceae bacterium]|nr:hypothetical protein [Tepidisphaeraceae bacterium]